MQPVIRNNKKFIPGSLAHNVPDKFISGVINSKIMLMHDILLIARQKQRIKTLKRLQIKALISKG